MEQLLKENVDYQLVPTDVNDEAAWDVRLLQGPCPETVVRFNHILLDGVNRVNEEVVLKYGFEIISSPSDHANMDNVELQEHVGDVLFSIVNEHIERGTLQSHDLTPYLKGKK